MLKVMCGDRPQRVAGDAAIAEHDQYAHNLRQHLRASGMAQGACAGTGRGVRMGNRIMTCPQTMSQFSMALALPSVAADVEDHKQPTGIEKRLM